MYRHHEDPKCFGGGGGGSGYLNINHSATKADKKMNIMETCARRNRQCEDLALREASSTAVVVAH